MKKKTTQERIEMADKSFIYLKFIGKWYKKFFWINDYCGKISAFLVGYHPRMTPRGPQLSYTMAEFERMVDKGDVALTLRDFRKIVKAESDAIEATRAAYVEQAMRRANLEIDLLIKEMKDNTAMEIERQLKPVG
jgi:hypothetical protein